MDLRILEIKDFIKVTEKEEFLNNIQYKYYFKIKKKVIFFNDKIFKILNDNNIQVHLKGNFIKDVENLDKYFDKIMNFKGYNEDIYRCRKKETDFFYLTDYHQVKKYGHELYAKEQQFIFNFKDSLDTEKYAQIFSDVIKTLFYKVVPKKEINEFLKTITIIPVPSSTKKSYEKRYKLLCKLISEKTGVVNGYDFIEILYDTKPKHANKSREKDYRHFLLDRKKIPKPHRVILIDDVVTTGESISYLRRKILDINNFRFGDCKPIPDMFAVAIVLGKTVIPREKSKIEKIDKDSFSIRDLELYKFKKSYRNSKYESKLSSTRKEIIGKIVYS
ncbi:MAG: hypothetical protein KHZ27_09520 [Fusobacterium sp.]|nr:hypothetical protein [Fusobacterium sp.]